MRSLSARCIIPLGRSGVTMMDFSPVDPGFCDRVSFQAKQIFTIDEDPDDAVVWLK